MNTKFLLLALITAAVSSCSTTYKSGQTPDDVYYSPARVVEEKVQFEREVTRPVSNTNYEEREIRMASYDRRWRDLNRDYDYDYAYNPYRYGYSYGYYYNPYYYPCPVYITGVSISNPKNTTARMTSLGSYTNTTTTVAPSGKFGTPTRVNTVRAYNNTNSVSSSSTGRNNNIIRRIITATDNNSRTSNDNSRTYIPSSNNSSSGSSTPSKSGSGSVSRPTRGN